MDKFLTYNRLLVLWELRFAYSMLSADILLICSKIFVRKQIRPAIDCFPMRINIYRIHLFIFIKNRDRTGSYILMMQAANPGPRSLRNPRNLANKAKKISCMTLFTNKKLINHRFSLLIK